MKWLLASLLLLASPALADMPVVKYAKKPCEVSDLTGVWRLKYVFEEPVGEAKKNFRQNPRQFLYFGEKQTFARLSGNQKYADAAALQSALRASVGKNVLQYVLQDKGILYLYTNGKAQAGMYCEMALEKKGRFNRGDITLTRVSTETNGPRVIELYGKPNFQGGAFADEPGAIKRQPPNQQRQQRPRNPNAQNRQ